MPDNIRFDIDRDVRIGLPEAVFCEGKPQEALLALLARFASDDEKPILFTRLSVERWEKVPAVLRSRGGLENPLVQKACRMQISYMLQDAVGAGQ